MSDLKITVDQLKNYLGTGLKCEHPGTKGHYWRLNHDETVLNTISIKVALEIGAKPICYRLSDLDKHIPELGFVPIEELRGLGWADSQLSLIIRYAYTHITFEMAQQIMNWHFWLFGDEYFEKGLVIDKLKKDE